MAFTTGPVELERMMKNNEVNVVDVRAAEDYAGRHILGAINLPKDQWETLKGLRRDGRRLPHRKSNKRLRVSNRLTERNHLYKKEAKSNASCTV